MLSLASRVAGVPNETHEPQDCWSFPALKSREKGSLAAGSSEVARGGARDKQPSSENGRNKRLWLVNVNEILVVRDPRSAAQNKRGQPFKGCPRLFDLMKTGEPWRARTSDPLIKSL